MSARFEPKTPVKLDPPKDDPITMDRLSRCNGDNKDEPIYVAIKGSVFDVSGKDSYAPGGSYHVFAGKHPNRALALSSTKPDDCVPEYEDLLPEKKQVLDQWYTFFSKRYNIVGKLVDGGPSL